MTSRSPRNDDANTPNQRVLLLAEDDVFNRDSVRSFFSREGFRVLEAGDEATAWRMAQEHTVHAAVIDLAMPQQPGGPRDHGCGIRLLWRLKEAFPPMGIVAFSAYDDHGGEFLKRIAGGVRGVAYKLKGCRPSALLNAVHDVMQGRVLIDDEVRTNVVMRRGHLLDALASKDERPYVEMVVDRVGQLKPYLRETAHLVANSCSISGVAKNLGITVKTAENYIGAVYEQLGLTDMGHHAPHLRKALILTKAFVLMDLLRPDAR